MKANEMYIGKNYILRDEIITLTMNHIYWIEECKYDISEFEPIPLTENILLKCGFSIHKNADSGDFKGYSFGVNPFSEDYILLIQKATIGYYYDNAFFKINYLHQLQNLYFALTGEELTINL